MPRTVSALWYWGWCAASVVTAGMNQLPCKTPVDVSESWPLLRILILNHPVRRAIKPAIKQLEQPQPPPPWCQAEANTAAHRNDEVTEIIAEALLLEGCKRLHLRPALSWSTTLQLEVVMEASEILCVEQQSICGLRHRCTSESLWRVISTRCVVARPRQSEVRRQRVISFAVFAQSNREPPAPTWILKQAAQPAVQARQQAEGRTWP
jgi:hypothetical protein